MSRKSSKSTPVVIANVLYSDDAYTGAIVGSQEWLMFLESGQTFYFDGAVKFTARRETRRNGQFWYAYAKRDAKLKKCYLGKAQDLTPARLNFVAESLAN